MEFSGSVAESVSTKPGELCVMLLELARDELEAVTTGHGPRSPSGDGERISLETAMNLDLWPAAVSLVKNIGKWSICTEDVEGSGASKGGLKGDRGEGEVLGNTEMNHVEDLKENTNEKLTVARSSSFVETMLSYLERIVFMDSSAGSVDYPASSTAVHPTSEYRLSSSEIEDVCKALASRPRVILALCTGPSNAATVPEKDNGDLDSYLPHTVWSTVTPWFEIPNTKLNLLHVWDFQKALTVIGKIKSGMAATKRSTLDYSILLDAMESCSADCVPPETFSSTEITPHVQKVLAEVMESYAKIMSIQSLNESSAVDVSAIPFTDASFYALLGHAVWLRNLVHNAWIAAAVATSCESSHPSPLRGIVIAGAVSGATRSAASDTLRCKPVSGAPIMGRVFDWFVRGGCRDNISDTDQELLYLFAEEHEREKLAAKKASSTTGSKAGGANAGGAAAASAASAAASATAMKAKKPGRKDKNADLMVDSKSPLCAILAVHPGGPLDESASIKMQKSSPSVQLERKVLQIFCQRIDETASSPNAIIQTSMSKLAEINGGLPIFSIQLLPPTAAVAAVSITSEDISGDNEKLPEIQVLASVPSSLAAAEQVVGIVLDVCEVHRDKCPMTDHPIPPPAAPTEPNTPMTEDSKTKKIKDMTDKEKLTAILDADHVTASLLSEPVESIVAKAIRRVTRIIGVRRDTLAPGYRLWLMHAMKLRPFPVPDLFSAIKALRGVQQEELLRLGLPVSALLMRLEESQSRFREVEAALITEVKKADPRMRDLCVSFQKTLPTSASPNRGEKNALATTHAKIKQDVEDLICRLGDVIDEVSDLTSRITLIRFHN